jgi:acyl-CoA reductase-like NAD-dependent aldehyde dehydrogenase
MASAPVLANFIGGKYVPSSSDSTLPVISPATSEVLRNVPMSNASDVDVAVVRGREAFQQWKLLTTKQRAGIMFKFHSLVEQHKDELAALIVEENGKNITEAHAEVAKGNETVEWACSLPQLSPGKILEVSKGIQCMEIRAPLGVVACIVPFNFPLMVPMWTIPIALTLGNCVICKPSEKVPNTMQRISELMVEAGIPAGVFQIVHGGAEVVTTLCNHTGIDAVTFVGSSKVAKIVSNICHAQNKRVLALGIFFVVFYILCISIFKF